MMRFTPLWFSLVEIAVILCLIAEVQMVGIAAGGVVPAGDSRVLAVVENMGTLRDCSPVEHPGNSMRAILAGFSRAGNMFDENVPMTGRSFASLPFPTSRYWVDQDFLLETISEASAGARHGGAPFKMKPQCNAFHASMASHEVTR